MRTRTISLLPLLLLTACITSQSKGPGSLEIAEQLAEQITPAFRDESSVLLLGFFDSDSDELHPANDALTSDLTIQLLNTPERSFRMINRKMLIDALEELKFSLSELTNTEKAQEVGGFLSADIIIRGTVSPDFVTVECTEVETLTLLAMGKYTASQRMVFDTSDPGEGESRTTGENAAGEATAESDSGESITILGEESFGPGSAMGAVYSRFEEEYGINVNYIVHPQTAVGLEELIEAEDIPDIVLFPQPGIAYDYLEAGYGKEISSWFSEAELFEAYEQTWLSAVTVNDTLVGLPFNIIPKSLIWYNPEAFQRYGYEVPQTLEELHELCRTMNERGHKAWSVTIGSGSATGWVLTDWIEDILLHISEVENYDAWVRGELPFNSPPVRAAVEEIERLWGNGDYVVQSPEEIVGTNYIDGIQRLFAPETGAFLHKQGWFLRYFLPEDVEIGRDIDFFPFPSPSAGAAPLLVSGDLFVPMSDDHKVRTFFRFILDAEHLKPLLDEEEHLLPYKAIRESWYPLHMRKLVSQVRDSDPIRFDASDMMPPDVNQAFWDEISRWAGGEQSLDATLERIDRSW